MTDPENNRQAGAANEERQRRPSRADDPSGAAGRPADAAGPPPGTVGQPAGRPESAASAQTDKLTHAADLLPSVSAPKGGGAIRGLGGKFSVSAPTGTGSMAVKLPFSPGRSGFTPALELSYESSSGNGPLGFGWSLGLPAITRKTDKGLPAVLRRRRVRCLHPAWRRGPGARAGPGGRPADPDPDGLRHALPGCLLPPAHRRELFSRIERWTATDTGSATGGRISRDNVTTLYGADPASRVADPADPARIFSWQICRSWDDKGNVAVYG